jgi:undecaprenyl pyrophosphate phosphatase UppP
MHRFFFQRRERPTRVYMMKIAVAFGITGAGGLYLDRQGFALPETLWPAATEFSFLVGIPTMLAAGGLKIFSALVDPSPMAMPEEWGVVLLGFIVSAIVSFLAVGWLLRYIQAHTFSIFGWYRIGLAGVLVAFFIFSR